MTSREILGGDKQSPGSLTLGKYAPSNSYLLPVRTFLERSEVFQTLLDIACLLYFAVFICSAASALGLFAYVAYLKIIS
ncbi:MAG: hypothetical protein JWO37_4136 [Acidimicrobiales bacterium]|nr:hypothetical protein [Acidimicrobiales bacterium]